MVMLPIYILGVLSNALVSSINSRKNIASTKAIHNSQADLQKYLHGETYRQQVANQLRGFNLTHGWPLMNEPSVIAETLESLRENDHIPLYLIIAPVPQAGITKELGSIWVELSNFLQEEFQLNSRWPIAYGGYKVGYPVCPAIDITNIFAGLKGVPVLYMAPYVTNREHVLGVTISFWGLGDSVKPSTHNFEIDVRKLYIDEIRRETEENLRRIKEELIEDVVQKAENELTEGERRIKNNIAIFAEEKRLLNAGNEFEYIDNELRKYKDVRPSGATYHKMAEKITSVIKLLSSSIADLYFVLEYDERPRYPEISLSVKRSWLPELFTRGMSNENKDGFTRTSGVQFLANLDESYFRMVVSSMGKHYARTYIDEFRKLSYKPSLEDDEWTDDSSETLTALESDGRNSYQLTMAQPKLDAAYTPVKKRVNSGEI